VPAQGRETIRFDAIPPFEDPGHRGFEIVITDAARAAPHVLESAHVTVQEHLLALVEIRPGVRLSQCRQAHHEQLHLAQQATQVHADGAEVDPGPLAEWVALGDETVDQRDVEARSDLGHVTTDRSLAHRCAVLLGQALPPRRAVWRCLRGAERSASNHPSISAFHTPNAGAALGEATFRRAATDWRELSARRASAPRNAGTAPGSTTPHAPAPGGSARTRSPSTSFP